MWSRRVRSLLLRTGFGRIVITSVKLFFCLLLIVSLLEYALFVLVVSRCRLDTKFADQSSNRSSLSVLMVSDLHLLGSRRGFWLDRIKREWAMYVTFQLAITYFRPESVFFLGDSFDEGQIAGKDEFDATADRFYRLFALPLDTKRLVVSGNHDVGFHDRMRHFEPYLRSRFEQKMQAAFVKLYVLNGLPIVSINSMALHGDRCDLCESATHQLIRVAARLRADCPNPDASILCRQRRPVLISHFPLFRLNDADCDEPDEANQRQKVEPMKPSHDCLSNASTHFLLTQLQPRAVFTGHTHYGCTTQHQITVIRTGRNQSTLPQQLHTTEYTLASFNWRNRPNPSFVYAHFDPISIHISKCVLPAEHWIFCLYVLLISGSLYVCGLIRIRSHSIPLLRLTRI
jgi:hypothetical protein